MNPFLGEVLGTMLLIVFGCGVVAGVLLKGSKAENSGWVLITMNWGLAVAVAVYAVGSISGAHLNPAVTLALATIGEFPWKDVPGYIIAQITGAFLGAVIVYFHYLPHWGATEDPNLKLAVFASSPAIHSKPSNLVSEILATFFFVLGMLAIGANEFSVGLNPLIIGLFIIVIGMSLGGTTGYSINPARDIGPRLAHFLLPIPGKGHSDWKYSWVNIIGPIIGAVYGATFYKTVFQGEIIFMFWVMSVITFLCLVTAFVKETPKKVRVQNKKKVIHL